MSLSQLGRLLGSTLCTQQGHCGPSQTAPSGLQQLAAHTTRSPTTAQLPGGGRIKHWRESEAWKRATHSAEHLTQVNSCFLPAVALGEAALALFLPRWFQVCGPSPGSVFDMNTPLCPSPQL